MAGIIILGSHTELELSDEVLDQRIENWNLSKIPPWISSKGINANWILNEETIRPIIQDYPKVEDDHPYTEFPLVTFLKKEVLGLH